MPATGPLRGPALLGICVLAALVLLDGATYRLGPWWSEPEASDRTGPSAAAGTQARTEPAAGAEAERSPRLAGGMTRATPPGDYPRPGPGLNLLALEASPYLQLHADNPVDWYPWGERAFARARAEDVPIFLSVGYSTCFWCHVMERKVFSDPEIATYMNEHFVSVKVDREERPDVDSLYMKATHLLTGHGGWPNSVFLTPEGRPFYAGTYFPPEDAHGRPGFPRVLRTLHEAWRSDRTRVQTVAGRVTEHITSLADPGAGRSGTPPAPDALVRDALRELEESYEPEHGGFSSRTKFPRPPTLDLLLTHLEDGEDETTAREARPDAERGEGAEENVAPGGERDRLLAMLTHTLDEMALGGIYDHLAGGFHRYSTEPTWSVPHFEKMLYDNAQLVSAYARAYALTGRPLYRRTVEETVAYLDRELDVPGGGFASAQDAQVEGEEGVSYVWSRGEIEEVLGAERAAAFLQVYQLAPMREHPDSGVLRVRLPVEPALEASGAENVAALLARFEEDRARLLEARRQRPQPLRDAKVLAAWNGLAIRGLVEAGLALERPEWVGRAAQAARFVLARLGTEDGGLRRSYVAGQARERGVLNDYAFLADGLLELHRATGEPRWLAQARRLADRMLDELWDPEGGGFYMTGGDVPLLARPKPFDDNAQPSGNAVALRVLHALAQRTGEARYARAAQGVGRAAAPLLERAPSALAATVAVLARGANAAGAASAVAEAGGAEGPPAAHANAAAETASSASGSGPGSGSGSGSEGGGDGFRLPRSEDHVRASLIREAGAPHRLRVRLDVEPGWHVNANPASLPFLVPTEIDLPARASEETGKDRASHGQARDGVGIEYPEAERFRPEFVEQAIEVYSGTLEIPVSLPPVGGDGQTRASRRVAVRFQACDHARCLPPARLELEIPDAAPPAAGPEPAARGEESR